MLDVAYERFDKRLFGLGLHRGVLFEALHAQCEAAERVGCHFGVDICDIEQTGDTVTVRSAEGKPFGPFDLLVIADGTASKLRPLLGIPSWFKQYSYGALFGLLPDEHRTFGRTLTQVHDGPGCHTTLGFLPTGVPWGHGVDTLGDGVIDTHAEHVTTLYYNLRVDEFAAWQRGGLDKFRDTCAALCPQAEDLLQKSLVDPHQLAFARYSDGVMWQYHKGRVAVIGDAAHSMSPQLGQGCNLALIDAEKLADAIVDAATSSSSSSSTSSSSVAGSGSGSLDLPAALASYTRARWSRRRALAAA